ncbi:MAG TPA: dihydroorotate dehydrogenase electron transfer subunit [Gammaproteobacteria bacterium]
MNGRDRRATIALEDAPILLQRSFPGDQHIIRLSAPRCAARATPGSFAHLTCDPSVPMRRPLSIMRAEADEGWIEFLYKPVGRGLAHLADRVQGDSVSILGPIGHGFCPDPERPKILALGGGVGIPPIYFLAERLRSDPSFEMFVIMGSEVPFPFELSDAKTGIPGISPSVFREVGDLAAWGIASRLASNAGFEGCHAGFVTDPARSWLEALGPAALAEVQVLGCGPMAMLAATASLARDFGLPCQVAVEEYMACGVGGCAGCTLLLQTPDGPEMKRVCVDGPVFDALQVFVDAAETNL